MMPAVGADGNIGQVTPPNVVLPFYIYAALSFLAATFLLFNASGTLGPHYFSPHALAITHAITLGWGTMIILGASHQLVPVLVEGRLYSYLLARLSFLLAAGGIPLLVYAFYTFNMGWPARWGAVLINAAILLFLVNITGSKIESKSDSVHVVFVITATIWLAVTTIMGLLLVYNFTAPLLAESSLHYLSLHAHTGMVGWFLLLVIGVGSRLIPMFLISRYSSTCLLWWIYGLTNTGLAGFIFIFLYRGKTFLYLLPVACVLAALALFGYYCCQCYRQRMRRRVDDQMKVSLLAVLMMVVPVAFLVVVIIFRLLAEEHAAWALVYGFTVLFGWLTAIILGMTFKTLPFIVWNKVYRIQAGSGKTPGPGALFSSGLFSAMALSYMAGFLFFVAGMIIANSVLVKAGALLLLSSAFLYNLNLLKITFHKPVS